MKEKAIGKKGVLVTAIIIAVLILIFGMNLIRAGRHVGQSEVAPEIIPVKVSESQIMEIEQVLELTGNIEALLEVDVFNKIPGKIIQDIYVETGDRIRAGEKIATLETDAILAKLERAKAALELARAGLKQAETNYELLVKDKRRLENLFREKAVSEQKMDHIEAQVKTALETKNLGQAQIKQAEATLKELYIAYKDHTLTAPISGYISKRYVDKGTMSSPGTPVIKISNEDVLKIVTSVTGKDIVDINKGMLVDIYVDAFPDETIKGSVSIVSPTINPDTRSGEIEIHIDNSDHRLRAGMFARVHLYKGKKQATVIDRDGLLKIPGTGNYYTFVVNDGQAVRKNVKKGVEQGRLTEIASGIEPGEKIVVTGQNRLKEGSPVSIQ
ncbi:MAG: efflux RND transporter periplasmic adaptor subunit [Desulfobacterales bacterium]